MKLAALWGGFLFFLVLYCASIQIFSFDLNVYDYQRLVQVVFLFLFFISLRECVWPDGLIGLAAFCFFASGLVSCFLSVQMFWSILEWFRIGLLFIFTLVVARSSDCYFRGVMTAVFFVSVLLCVKLFVGLFVIVSFGGGLDVLADGFSNHRHFSEFFIALGLFVSFSLLRVGKLFFATSSFFVCWMVVFLGAGRASFLALLAGFFMFFFVGERRNYSLLMFLISGFLAWLMCVLFFDDSVFLANGILRDGSSGRFSLWGEALSSWSGNVFWGVGPMHFAFYSTKIAAHPHNLLVQVLVEWGGVAFLSGGLFLGSVAVKLYEFRFDLGEGLSVAWSVLFGMLVSSLFGGVWVVPLVELVFFLFLGVVLRSVKLGRAFVISGAICRVLAVCLISLVAIAWMWRDLDVPRGAVLDAPRFWQNGGIPID